MDCKHVNDHLVDYLYQELDADQLDQIEGHLKECEGCANELATFESTRQLMQQLPQLEPSTSVTDKLLAAATQAVQPEPTPGFWERVQVGLRMLVVHPAMTAAVALVLVLGISFYAYRQTSPPSSGPRADLPEVVARPAPAGAPATKEFAQEADPSAVADEESKDKDQVLLPVAKHKVALEQPVAEKGGKAAGRGTLRTVATRAPKSADRPRKARRRRPRARPAAKPTTTMPPKPAPRAAEAQNPYDALAGSGKADYKSPKRALRQKKTKGPGASHWLANARKANKLGKCELALRYYHRALEQNPQLRRSVGPEVQHCARMVARRDQAKLAKIQQQLPLLAGWLDAEMAVARRRAAKRKTVKARKKAAPRKAPTSTLPAAD